ncbi:MAG: hypothetical protein ACRC5T_06125 [Cetobacterium sp.]
MSKIIAIMGHTGSGKSTIEKELIVSGMFSKFLSTTTRDPREGEENGIDYNFISDESFNMYKDADMFIEHMTHAIKTSWGQYGQYGFLKKEMNKLKKNNCVCVLTPQGYLTLKEKIGDVVEIVPYYIKTDEQLRFAKIKERHSDNLEKYIEEINRRFVVDREMFKDVESLEGITIVENNFDEESKENIIMAIINNLYIKNERGDANHGK